MSTDPPRYTTPLGEGAEQLHELFRAYVVAGFTEEQALRLIALQSFYAQSPPDGPER